jgi:hypothetical protein
VNLFEETFHKRERTKLLLHVLGRMDLEDLQTGTVQRQVARKHLMIRTKPNQPMISLAKAALLAAKRHAENTTGKGTESNLTQIARSPIINNVRLVMACQWLIEKYGCAKSKAELESIRFPNEYTTAARSLSMSFRVEINK